MMIYALSFIFHGLPLEVDLGNVFIFLVSGADKKTNAVAYVVILRNFNEHKN